MWQLSDSGMRQDMKITKFDIRNFKGITNASIHLADGTPGNVGMLIGLNESGKTTILEALSHFVTEDKDTATLVGTVHQRSSIQDLIPKDKKAAFTGFISISANVLLEEDDVNELSDLFEKEHNLVLDKESLAKTVVVERVYEFKDSNHEHTHTWWRRIYFPLKTKKAKKFISYSSEEPHRKMWLVAVNFLNSRLPKIVYFPTFLFDFPDRIYLEDNDNDEINSYYKQVIQDVLDSHGEGLSVQKHIIERIERVRNEHPSATSFMALLFGRDEKKQIDAVLQIAANQMTKVIFGSWNEILNRNVAGKRIQIEWLLNAERDNAPYLEISIEDGQTFKLSERSLGFRWFFSFLLFTQFRKDRRNNGSTIFLFDEPAANLHSKPQMKLLESFGRIAQGTNYIFYSTHSHYMVNPLWLERAYIVENKVTDYDDDDVASFAIKKTDISAIPYRSFVGSYPTKTTYFQPVLDALEVTFSPMIKSKRALIVEGKNDYFPILYFCRLNDSDHIPEIYPSNGAGSASALISLFRGWGVEFKILLDDDRSGREAKKKYMNEFFLSASEVVTLGDIDENLIGRAFESIYQDDLRNIVGAQFNESNPNKRHFSLYFQELISTSEKADCPSTVAAFQPLSDWIQSVFS
jgi:predicted ATP-dependent endonuclease of OLD family